MERAMDPTTTPPENQLVERARAGDRAALEQLVRTIKDLVFNLAVRMLGDPTDAEDATQEILIRVVTHLASFRGESAFRTWVYRVASNHLLTARRRRAEERVQSFEAMGELLDEAMAAKLPALDDQLVLREAKLRCTTTMLLCLDRDHRLAFIFGGILELAGEEAAEILEIAPDAFRKRLSRARQRMDEFMRSRCGLVDEALPCRCGAVAASSQAAGHLYPLRFADRPGQQRAAPRLADIERLQRAVALFRGHPYYEAPESLVDGMRRALDSSSSDLLD
jgi:RNA polymerase sigma factor (sigma-70 family)